MWPNKFSLYTHPRGGQGPWADVSFDRPYGRQSQFAGIVNDPLSVGSGEFLSFEQPLSYFLEQHGYDVTYCSNSDLLTPDRELKCKAFVSVGHDEYWDIRQFPSVEMLRDRGVNLRFLSGNSVCWVTPFRAGYDGRPNRIIFRGGPYTREQQMRAHFGKLVFDTVLPDLATFERAVTDAVPITEHARRSRAAAIARSLFDEVCQRSRPAQQESRRLVRLEPAKAEGAAVRGRPVVRSGA